MFLPLFPYLSGKVLVNARTMPNEFGEQTLEKLLSNLLWMQGLKLWIIFDFWTTKLA